MHPDPDKVRAIIEMSAPTNVHELQQIQGMTNYIETFITNLATIEANERPLKERHPAVVGTSARKVV